MKMNSTKKGNIERTDQGTFKHRMGSGIRGFGGIEEIPKHDKPQAAAQRKHKETQTRNITDKITWKNIHTGNS